MSSRDVPGLSDPSTYNVANRRYPVRVDVLGQVEAHSVWRLKPVFLRELSQTGFSIESTSPYEVGLVHKFRLGIQGHRKSMVVQAKAVHCKLQSISADLPIYIIGFQLVDPGDLVKREMAALVDFATSMWNEELDTDAE